ncbi:hypothetical protein DIPPA_26260 [Diplonema papillatum]|nr:hypothetical protein DIPPA_26260 [Diplonema papillatum]
MVGMPKLQLRASGSWVGQARERWAAYRKVPPPPIEGKSALTAGRRPAEAAKARSQRPKTFRDSVGWTPWVLMGSIFGACGFMSLWTSRQYTAQSAEARSKHKPVYQDPSVEPSPLPRSFLRRAGWDRDHRH